MSFIVDPYVNPLSPYSPLSPFSTISTISTISPITPISKVTVTPYSTTVTTTNVIAPLTTVVEYESGLNDSYIAQRDMTKYLLDRILNKWLYDDICNILKYLVVEKGNVKSIGSKSAYQNNKICNDTIEDVELKIDWINENILGIKEMRKILQKIINELGYKWYELSEKPAEQIVVEATERYLRNKLKERIPK